MCNCKYAKALFNCATCFCAIAVNAVSHKVGQKKQKQIFKELPCDLVPLDLLARFVSFCTKSCLMRSDKHTAPKA